MHVISAFKARTKEYKGNKMRLICHLKYSAILVMSFQESDREQHVNIVLFFNRVVSFSTYKEMRYQDVLLKDIIWKCQANII